MLLNLPKVLRQYQEPHRFYHNLTHIRRMFELAESLSLHLTGAQWLAVMFHDAIYDTTSKTNEADSVDFMWSCVKPDNTTEEDEVVYAGEIIVATQHHSSQDSETAIVLDLDLAELGGSWDRYAFNEQNIRTEYSQYDDDQWRTGRAKFLNSMLERNYIYNTVSFRKLFEQRARDNLLTALTELS